MYPLGFLFGLGFDTATEIGLLGIAAAEASKGLSIWSILVFPALFTAGMSLVDTTDGILMLGAYGWAFVKPIRKLYYNLTITFVSVLVAAADRRHRGARPDRRASSACDGGVLAGGGGAQRQFRRARRRRSIGFFAASWLISFIVYRVKRYDEIEAGSS